MAIVTLKEILKESIMKKYAVGAFDSMNHIMTEAILEAAAEKNVPVILMFPGDVLERTDADDFFSCTRMLAKGASVPVALHLDHGSGFDICMKAIHYGFGSVMFDGSSLQIEENISITKKVVAAAHACGVSVEAEVGHVGGLEGGTGCGFADTELFTKTEDAVRFAEETEVDALAIAIGTVHGLFKSEPCIDIERLKEIRDKVKVPLVLHGGTGLADEEFRNVISHGINKVNFFTGISYAAVESAKELLDRGGENGNHLHVFELMDCCKESIKEVVRHQIKVFGTQPLQG